MKKIFLLCIMGLMILTACSSEKKTEKEGAAAYKTEAVFPDELPVYVKKDGKVGFIDKMGNMVIEPKFAKPTAFPRTVRLL